MRLEGGLIHQVPKNAADDANPRSPKAVLQILLHDRRTLRIRDVIARNAERQLERRAVINQLPGLDHVSTVSEGDGGHHIHGFLMEVLLEPIDTAFADRRFGLLELLLALFVLFVDKGEHLGCDFPLQLTPCHRDEATTLRVLFKESALVVGQPFACCFTLKAECLGDDGFRSVGVGQFPVARVQ